MNIRAVQRTLFRMQLDPDFAAAVLGGDAAAAGHLDADERALLRSADPAGVLADFGGKRRAQVVGNASSEYVLSLVEVDRRGIAIDVLAEFPRSAPFHVAIAAERSLPLAFGEWLRGRVAAHPGVLGALVTLEFAMASARRASRAARRAEKGEIALAADARLLDLPDGAFDHAQAMRAAVDGGAAPPRPARALEMAAAAWMAGEARALDTGSETVLLVAPAAMERHGLRSVAAERLAPAVATLLRAIESPLDAEAVAALVTASVWDATDVDACVADLVAEGVVVRGD